MDLDQQIENWLNVFHRLWIAGVCTIGLYVPAYIIERRRRRTGRQPPLECDPRLDPDQGARGTVDCIDEGDEAVKLLLWVPLPYTTRDIYIITYYNR